MSPSSEALLASAIGPAPLPVPPACVSMRARTLCTLPTQSYCRRSTVRRSCGYRYERTLDEVPPASSGGCFELTTPRRDGCNVQAGRAGPSGRKRQRWMQSSHQSASLRIRRDSSPAECQEYHVVCSVSLSTREFWRSLQCFQSFPYTRTDWKYLRTWWADSECPQHLPRHLVNGRLPGMIGRAGTPSEQRVEAVAERHRRSKRTTC